MLCLVIILELLKGSSSPDAVPEGVEQSWTVVMGVGGSPFWWPSIAVLGLECPRVLTSVLTSVLMALFHHSLVLILSEGKGLLMKGLSFQAPGASAQFPVLLNTVDFH